MAQNKRVALSLPPDLDEALTRLSLILNQPKTAIITELLVDSLPVIIDTIKAIEQVKEGQEKLAIETMGKFLGEASGLVNQAHIELGGLKAKHGK